MGRPFIVMGDRTSHGGVVVEASQLSLTHNKPIARVGDQVTCPIPGHGTTVIVEGDPTMIIDGKPAARHGDKCACGAVLISSQVVSTVGTGGSGSSRSGSSSASTATSSSSDPSLTVVPKELLFDDKLILIDDESGGPLGQTEYAIKRASGEIEYGTTNDFGETHLLSETAKAELIEIYV